MGREKEKIVMKKPLRALGVTCGIGSMLLGARKAGFKVTGNLEWRKYYFAEDELGRNTFRANFDDAIFKHNKEELTPQEIERLMDCDIALGHPECGAYSQLNANRDAVNDPGDIPLFVDLIKFFKPRFFVMDDLPKSFVAFPMSEYHVRLPDYDLFPEWVSNFGYGNTQKARNRFFMLGALKTEKWAFVPGEERHGKTVAEVIGDLEGMEGNFPNHDRHVLSENCAKGLHLHHRDHRATWGEMRRYIIEDVKEGGPIHYVGEDGRQMIRVGSYKGHWDGPAHVLTGGISGFHPRKGVPYTIRERARLQGFPDDFSFHGTVYSDEEGQRRWNHDKNMHMIRQTGKAMPIQFCEYVSRQISAHITEQPFSSSNARVIAPNQYVDEAKAWYCENVGYAAQPKACQACSQARGCAIRERMGIPLVQNQAALVGPAGVSRTPEGHRGSIVSPTLRDKVSKRKDLTPARGDPVVLKGDSGGPKSKSVKRTIKQLPKPAYRQVPTTLLSFGED